MSKQGTRERPTLVVALFLVAAGCGPSEAEREREKCEETPECIEGVTCDTACRDEHLEIAECCDCLAELQCLGNNLTENRCNENLQRDGTIAASAECATDESRCGTVCGFLSFAG